MINKATMPILLALVLFQSFPVAALAGGAAFVRVGQGPGVAAGISASSRGGPRASVYIRVGNRWVPSHRGYYVATPIYEARSPFAEGQLSGTASSGAHYFNGYRVLPSGWVRVLVEPGDAVVLVNGFAVVTERVSGISKSLGLPVGKHHVEVRKDGFQTYQTELEVQQAREILLQVKLDP